MYKRDNGTSGHDTLVIVLSTVFGIIGVVLIALVGFWFLRNRRRHRLFNRGLTPIGDDEIETWKVNRREEKESEAYRPLHVSKDSTSSAKIQYQKGVNRPSTDAALSTRSFINNSFSIDLPRAPEPAAFARAPNARTGLTDETVPGDDPFVPVLKRQPSRLQKLPPNTPKNLSRANSRTRLARSNSHPENWFSNSTDSSPTGSKESKTRGGHSRIYSSSSIPPKISSSSDKEIYGGLSPPPSRRQDTVIGQALG
ncbi:hypothetical protein ONZ43_g652 [Nemania bipapillata]|uniref:Uncharacterized protein n=1 Tax=Nemania bipapillata TaxID=110536 RepID=A0ACC2J7I7_9PEZI|nr:hypothetical protein ONZ43_g652 [Nemania bipapillata]